MKVTAEMLRDKEIAIHGSKDEVIEKILRIKETCGYDDFMFCAWFELGGFDGAEIEAQMQFFAEEIMPVLRRECGGSPELQVSPFDFDVSSNGHTKVGIRVVGCRTGDWLPLVRWFSWSCLALGGPLWPLCTVPCTGPASSS